MQNVAVSPPNNLAILRGAEKIVHRQFPRAIIHAALGTSISGTAVIADDFDKWHFIGRVEDNGEPRGVFIDWTTAGFGRSYLDDPCMGSELRLLPRRMSLSHAIRLVHICLN